MSRQMIVATTLEELDTCRALLDDPLGFVPTMGYLHEGHLSLARRARAECRSVAVSIFVNPTQFGPSEDLAKYPRDLERDLRLLEEAEVDLVWTPTAEIMYPKGYQTWVEVAEVSLPLEGAQRPGHFRGVTTVVGKLFNAVRQQPGPGSDFSMNAHQYRGEVPAWLATCGSTTLAIFHGMVLGAVAIVTVLMLA